MACPRPSLTLVLDIDERLDNQETRLEIDRCYAHVGTTIVRTHARETFPARTFAQAAQQTAQAKSDGTEDAEDAEGTESVEGACNDVAQKTACEPEAANVARMLVKLGTRKYLHSADEGADELWDNVVGTWLFNEFHKVGNNLQIFNRRQNEIGNEPLPFSWLDVELQNGEVCVWMHLDSESGIDPHASEHISRMRALLNDGALGKNVASVVMPDPADYKRQFEEGIQAKAKRIEAGKRAQEEAEAANRAAREEAAKLADEAFLESPVAEIDEARARKAEEAELAAKYDLAEPDFAIDYHLWRVEYADGASRVFDSEKNAFSD